ncbi:MAG: hypothetical protein CBHOC_4442 [uncultured Caballeronia sp.]|nr:MAG: hypothetical protein CBHOC_4442 [uncultured Caballeronia sp.]
MSRRDDVSIRRGRRIKTKHRGRKFRSCQMRSAIRSVIQYRFPEEFGPASTCRVMLARTGALHAGNAVAGVAKTAPYIEEASR